MLSDCAIGVVQSISVASVVTFKMAFSTHQFSHVKSAPDAVFQSFKSTIPLPEFVPAILITLIAASFLSHVSKSPSAQTSGPEGE